MRSSRESRPPPLVQAIAGSRWKKVLFGKNKKMAIKRGAREMNWQHRERASREVFSFNSTFEKAISLIGCILVQKVNLKEYAPTFQSQEKRIVIYPPTYMRVFSFQFVKVGAQQKSWQKDMIPLLKNEFLELFFPGVGFTLNCSALFVICVQRLFSRIAWYFMLNGSVANFRTNLPVSQRLEKFFGC